MDVQFQVYLVYFCIFIVDSSIIDFDAWYNTGI